MTCKYCHKPAHSREMCGMHYTRWWRHGKDYVANIRNNDEERFWGYVDVFTDPNGCWEWMASLSHSGYGQFHIKRDGKYANVRAHRWAYEKYVAPIPVGYSVLHRCDNPVCIRPDHLFTGTPLDNMLDMRNKGRHSFGEKVVTAKLTADNVQFIRSSSMRQIDLADMFNVSQPTISAVKRRVLWKHI